MGQPYKHDIPHEVPCATCQTAVALSAKVRSRIRTRHRKLEHIQCGACLAKKAVQRIHKRQDRRRNQKNLSLKRRLQQTAIQGDVATRYQYECCTVWRDQRNTLRHLTAIHRCTEGEALTLVQQAGPKNTNKKGGYRSILRPSEKSTAARQELLERWRTTEPVWLYPWMRQRRQQQGGQVA